TPWTPPAATTRPASGSNWPPRRTSTAAPGPPNGSPSSTASSCGTSRRTPTPRTPGATPRRTPGRTRGETSARRPPRARTPWRWTSRRGTSRSASMADGPSELLGTSGPLVADHDVALLDLDGVVYIGRDAVPGAHEALDAVRADGVALRFVTNNASRTPQSV